MKRRYDSRLRRAGAEEARRRIIGATVHLHAERGALGTSHVMIAKRAGVSVPTVYKYFPSRNHLVPACTGSVLRESPVALGERLFDGLATPSRRVHALALAVFRLHEYLAPWARWAARDAAELPALRRFLADAVTHRRRLIRRALGPAPTRRLVALAELLLDWPAWRALTTNGETTDQAAAVVADAIIHLSWGGVP